MNTPTGIGGLLSSRAFLLAVLDAVISLILYFTAKYAGVALDDVKLLILTLQPILIAVIASYTVNDLGLMQQATQLKIHEMTLTAQVVGNPAATLTSTTTK